MLPTNRLDYSDAPRLWRFRPYTVLRINARTRLLRDWRYLKATTA